MSWYLMVWKRYVDFSGRSRRSEYWYFALFNFIIEFVLVILAVALGGFSSGDGESMNPIAVPVFFVCTLYVLATFIPSLAVGVRRLHDTGRSAWWILINFIPYAGGIWFIVLMCLDSVPGPNQWGPNPKETAIGATA